MILSPSSRNRLTNRAGKLLRATGSVALNLTLDLLPSDVARPLGHLFSKTPIFTPRDEKCFIEIVKKKQDVLRSKLNLRLSDVTISRGSNQVLLIQVTSNNDKLNDFVANKGISRVESDKFAILIEMKPATVGSNRKYTAEILKPMQTGFSLNYSFVYCPQFPRINNLIVITSPNTISTTFRMMADVTKKVNDLIQKAYPINEYLNTTSVRNVINSIINSLLYYIPSAINVNAESSQLQKLVKAAKERTPLSTLNIQFIERRLIDFLKLLKDNFVVNPRPAVLVPMKFNVDTTTSSIIFTFIPRISNPQLEDFSIEILFSKKKVKFNYRDFAGVLNLNSYTMSIPGYDTWEDSVLRSSVSDQEKYWKEFEEKIVLMLSTASHDVENAFSQLLSRIENT